MMRSQWQIVPMTHLTAIAAVLSLGLSAAAASAADLAPVPASLMNRAAIVCVKVSKAGKVSDAFVVQSTGDGKADADVVDWIRTLSWPASGPADPLRGNWQPVPVAMGQAAVPTVPGSCAPPRAVR